MCFKQLILHVLSRFVATPLCCAALTDHGGSAIEKPLYLVGSGFDKGFPALKDLGQP
jgi:hypothetical protein